MASLGRVNTMVDGVIQTFFGTSIDNGKYHEGNGNMGTSSFGAMIDQNFLVAADAQKGHLVVVIQGLWEVQILELSELMI